MYHINKMVGWISSPLGVFFIGFCAGCLLVRRGGRARRAGAWTIALSAVFLWIMSCGMTTRFLGVPLERPWEREGAMHGSFAGLPEAGAIVVLGGGAGSHQECRAPELYSGADRVWQGARLYLAMKSRIPGLRIFCTGGGCEYATVPLLTELGVPREAIWFSEEPRNTQEEARLIKKAIEGSAGVAKPKILLVTSAWHMSRAKTLFERAGFEVVPAPADFEMSCKAEEPVSPGDFFPTGEALLRNSSAVKEWVALLCYRIAGCFHG